jgi:hypothetical protein
MRKPNYRFERAERDRLKQAKKEEKLKRRQQERLAAESGDSPDTGPTPEEEPRRE